MKNIILILLVGLCSCHSASKVSKESLPDFVVDYANILPDKEEANLENWLKGYEVETTNEIVVFTVTDIDSGVSVFQYSLDLAKHLGIGKKDKNNGVLILIAPTLRKVQIQNGIGIEDKFTDAETKLVIDEIMLPFFKTGNYIGGLYKGIDNIMEQLK